MHDVAHVPAFRSFRNYFDFHRNVGIVRTTHQTVESIQEEGGEVEGGRVEGEDQGVVVDEEVGGGGGKGEVRGAPIF